MTRQVVRTDGAPANPNYSQAVRAAGLVFVSGQGPLDPASGAIVGDTIEEQTRQCLTNVRAILEAAGSSLDRIVNMTFVLADPADFAGMNEEYAKVFAVDPPARAVTKLGVELPGVLVSIMMTAHVEG